jgi:RNA-dependent RNA polymerase
MRNIPYAVSDIELNRQLRPTLHGPLFEPVFQGGAPFDYRIQLFRGKRRGQSHSGNGVLTVPTEAIGLRLIELGSIFVHGRAVAFTRSNRPARPEHISMVQRAYQDPVVREREGLRRAELATQIGISRVQFCWAGFKEVSIEWEKQGSWFVSFDDNSRAVLLQLNPWRIVIRNTTIESIEEDGDFCHLSLEYPPTLEVEPETQADPFNLDTFAEALGLASPPALRDRQSALEEEQQAIVPFVNVLRLCFADRYSGGEKFKSKMRLIDRRVHGYHGPRPAHRGLFTAHSLGNLQDWCRRQEYSIAFQVHRILCKRLIAPVTLLELVPTLGQIIQDLNSDEVVDILKRFGQIIEEPEEGMEDWKPGQLLEFCIDNRATNVARRVVSREEMSRLFECYHVLITPTSQLLSGPIPETSNRVLRWYPDYQHHFLRVEFAEEDGNNLRLDREVDNAKFVQKRFGGVLVNGIKVAGRRFEFLAYSQSALREHAVWFISPFSTSHKCPRNSLLNDVDL